MAEAKRNESEETRRKRSEAAKNRIRRPTSDETKSKIGAANTGKRRTDEAKQKQSARKKGKTWEEIFGIEGAAARREEHRIRREERQKLKGPNT